MKRDGMPNVTYDYADISAAGMASGNVQKRGRFTSGTKVTEEVIDWAFPVGERRSEKDVN
jgi:hypothetical protein